MSKNFVISEAEESDQEEDLEPHERARLKKLKAIEDSSEEDEEDDENEAQEILKDLIDDREIEDDDSDGSIGPGKRKKSDEEDEDDDRLEDDDYDLLEENLGVKVQRRKRFKRVRPQIDDDDSDGEDQNENGDLQREIAERIFESDEDTPVHKEHDPRRQQIEEELHSQRDNYEDDEEGEDSDDDDGFIVDDDGIPITSKRKTKKVKYGDVSLQEGQDIFGVDFDYDEFEKYDEDDYDEDEYEMDGGGDMEKRPKKAAKKRSTKKSIFEIYEPSELKRGHFTDVDIEIRKRDMPERMQLRDVPVTSVPEGSTELEDEAEWIYKQAFCKDTVSNQDVAVPGGAEGGAAQGGRQQRKPPSTITKIRQALDFMRNQQLEVPFIAFYRKEYVKPELNINDLWKVYKFDGKWCQLLARKRAVMVLFEKMRSYQEDQFKAAQGAIPDDVRLIQDEDIERLKSVQTPEELKDVHMHFLLHYSHEIPKMNDAWRRRQKEHRQKRRQEERERLEQEIGEDPDRQVELDEMLRRHEEEEEREKEEEDQPQADQLKQAVDTGPYSSCRKAGILGMAKRFGLTPEQFAENLRDNYQRHEVEQEQTEPIELARQYLGVKFSRAEDVLEACQFVVARQISKEPLLRKSVREIYFERARLSVRPTKQGAKEIDENHPCYGMKWLKNKPVRDFVGDQFLRLHMAEEDKLLEITIHERLEGMSSGTSYLEEVKSLYQRDEFAKNVQDWNKLRANCVEIALTKMVLPDLRKELRAILLQEAKEAVMRACSRKLSNWLKVAPYAVQFPEEDDYEWDASKGLRVMGLAYVPDPSQAAFCALISGEGEVTDYLRVPNILRKRGQRGQDGSIKGDADLMAIKDFVRNKKPHVIALGGESREALHIQQNLREVIKELVKEEQFPEISVEIVDNELAKIYSNSKKGQADFREYPTLLRQAISCARKLQDPLVEFSQLCTADEEILCLRYNTLQDQLVREELLENLYLEFINRTNEIGVDVNLATQNPLYVNLVQFVCGLGPRKGAALIKILKQTNQRLENRTQLVTHCHMGPKVFINCSGFIKIDTSSLGDSTEAYVEVLDGSRVHPETYEWARKMAIDALEYDDEQMNPAGALDEILDSPERLKDLDLDAFAVELERQGFGNKSITLYDIRAELHHRYKDLRKPYRSPTAVELFDILTKETPETFYVGKMVLATVTGFTYKRPQPEQLDQANPVRNEETGLWQCPFCMKTDFPELSEVWNHFDAKSCPGQATGVRLVLDNDLSGFIHIKNLSDKHVKNPEERVQKQQTIHVRIIKIDVERFSVDCTSKSTDLMDKNHEWRPTKDQYYDQEAEDAALRKEDDSKKAKARQHYVKRVIVHPAFHNKSYTEALKVMEAMDQGEVIIRPSSKGPTHLTVTWKVADNIYQHIDVREEGKENEFSLGKSLWIGNEEYEDLDEIIARHVNPMASYARDLLTYKYYKDTNGGQKAKAEEILKEEKKKNSNKIHYMFSVAKNYPGKFLLSYLPRATVRHEYVTITPEGFRYRQQLFDNMNALLKWFKEHFRDPVPVANTPMQATPRHQQAQHQLSARPSPYGTTPGQMSTSNSMSSADAIAKVAQNMPSQLLHSLSQVTSHQTPHYTHTPGGASSSSAYGGQSNYVNTPYTPSGQTPFMTPYTSQTPRYGQTTPSMSGPFVMPGVPASGGSYHGGSSASGRSSNPGYHQSPQQPVSRHHHGSSPYVQSSPHSRYATNAGHEGNEWARANDAWARGSGSHTPRGGSGRTPRQDDGQKSYSTHRKSSSSGGYDEMMMRPPSRARSDYGKSPRTSSGRTPSQSPHQSVMMGDATPLHDEN